MRTLYKCYERESRRLVRLFLSVVGGLIEHCEKVVNAMGVLSVL